MHNELFCYTEYEALQKVIVCSPTFMSTGETKGVPKWETEQITIDIDKAMSQHGEFVKKLKEYEIEVVPLSPQPEFSEGVFTRDVGFILGEKMFISKMAHPPRFGEEKNLIHLLNDLKIPHQDLNKDHIEGGDVLIDRNWIYIGESNRTHKAAIEHMRTLLPQFEILALPFSDQFLHLDCVFNIISPTEALIYPGEFGRDNEAILATRYDLIEVTQKEQATLGINVLSIGNRRIISQPINEGVNKQLRARGYEVIEIDFSEIIKAGGAFRCCSLPLIRKINDE
ncbi:dimethylarginine dimethylaminohydrolase family protein [Cytobacillus sp. FJAT-54145]|uniref:Dimethylarginine dimethylaminohydrolase family protein n=1 Tax=Cytobacillus spartinae TaxID=3299023 RepID=A0ABW6K756_9BACI